MTVRSNHSAALANMSERTMRSTQIFALADPKDATETRRARKAVDSPSLKAHMDVSMMQSDSEDNFHGRKWKKVIKPSDQTAPGRLQSEMDQVFTKSFARIGVQDRPREDFFGPSTVLEKSSMKRPSSSQSQRSKARLDFEKQSTMFREENGVNGILAGAGACEIPWKSKRHVAQTSSQSALDSHVQLDHPDHGGSRPIQLDKKQQDVNICHGSPDKDKKEITPKSMEELHPTTNSTPNNFVRQAETMEQVSQSKPSSSHEGREIDIKQITRESNGERRKDLQQGTRQTQLSANPYASSPRSDVSARSQPSRSSSAAKSTQVTSWVKEDSWLSQRYGRKRFDRPRTAQLPLGAASAPFGISLD